MKENNNSRERDIVDRIVDQLKSSEELPYEDGAWERFRKDHLPKTTAKRILPLWISTAAACAVLMMLGLWYFNSDIPDLDQPALSSRATKQVQAPVIETPETPSVFNEPIIPQNTHVGESVSLLPKDSRLHTVEVVESWIFPMQKQTILAASPVDINNDIKLSDSKLYFHPDQEEAVLTESGLLPSVFADSKGVQTNARKEVMGESKHFRFTDRFNLGVVVAPSSTDQKVNFGGGLMLSYNVTKNLSVRTGATFHQYEVGSLRDPIQSATMEVAATAPERPLPTDMPVFSNAMMARMPLIPNVNSVTGMVRTLDIPVEAKYSFYKGIYAGVGVSYAAVLDQQRFAHYIENVNANPYANGLPSNESELRAAVQPVVRTLESANTNVNSAGFGGFVNMSLGKELKIRRGPSVSLEPYVKLPVGNFRRADMNYTNGGIRVITNF
ncbi:hypothetical protein M8998_04605 [Sphingobacterium sp. lm-10]|uniref:hypothetical protein n=1 Tax=Sphingobacterium sp. lm-10 TaxID=2944904 RepID=UPI002022357E|nr:hypothetical protein [Sphingobacterium sp. lm-10]MCL7987220.1 hypothetical protein [Sphingobacterium sp. lm-10]